MRQKGWDLDTGGRRIVTVRLYLLEIRMTTS